MDDQRAKITSISNKQIEKHNIVYSVKETDERKRTLAVYIKKKIFNVYNQRMAGYLMQRGFVLMDIQPDLKKTGRNVFLFNDTLQLRSAIDDYMRR